MLVRDATKLVHEIQHMTGVSHRPWYVEISVEYGTTDHHVAPSWHVRLIDGPNARPLTATELLAIRHDLRIGDTIASTLGR
jgi:hypothetical protein